jgi:hypothetical protein
MAVSGTGACSERQADRTFWELGRTFVWIVALAFSGSIAAADNKSELAELYAAVSLLNQEQQAVFQQFQMVQELRRANDRDFYASQLSPPQYAAGVPNYADLVSRQQEVVRRGEDLAQQANRIYADYAEIEGRKKALQQRIYDLTLAKEDTAGAGPVAR